MFSKAQFFFYAGYPTKYTSTKLATLRSSDVCWLVFHGLQFKCRRGKSVTEKKKNSSLVFVSGSPQICRGGKRYVLRIYDPFNDRHKVAFSCGWFCAHLACVCAETIEGPKLTTSLHTFRMKSIRCCLLRFRHSLTTGSTAARQ